jgi:hypothetical protein
VKEEGQGKKDGGLESRQSPVKLRLILKSPAGTKRVGRQQAKPDESDAEEESAEELTPDSPTINKRRRIVLPSPSIATRMLPATRKPPIVGLADDRAGVAIVETATQEDTHQPSLDNLLQQHGVHTPAKPYREHLLSRHAPVTTNPVVYIPPNVRRSFKPLPTAAEIQQDIQNKVRQKLKALEVIIPCSPCRDNLANHG